MVWKLVRLCFAQRIAYKIIWLKSPVVTLENNHFYWEIILKITGEIIFQIFCKLVD